MSLMRLPGLIDPHVHVRDLDQSLKEDWDSCTAAALAGGFTTVLAMPNTQPPIVDEAALAAYERAAAARARCDYGFHFGAGPDNADLALALAARAVGLKLYLDQTFGPLRLEGLSPMLQHARRWPAAQPWLCHAEGRVAAAAILIAHLAGRPVHICHVSRQDEIELIRVAKQKGLRVTCEVAPHHLFLSELDAPAIGAGRSEVRPRLGTPADCAGLRANLDVVDCLATDHAPHTLAEKDASNPPPGYPGLETALALYLELVQAGVLTMEGLLDRTVHNPRRIFGLPEQLETWIEVDPEAAWTARGAEMHTRARWTPFEGRSMRGRVVSAVIRGREAYRDGAVLAQLGSGINVRARQFSG